MVSSQSIISFLPFISLILAAPTPADLAPRCGSTVYPSILQTITESSPSDVSVNTVGGSGLFHVAQQAGPTNRISQIVGFTNIPAGSYGCTLGLTIPTVSSLTTTGSPTLNVTTLFVDHPDQISTSNNWSWNTIVGQGAGVTQGLFGTVNVNPGTAATVNSEACPANGGNAAFLLSVASWVSGNVDVQFNEYYNAMNGQGLTGFYMTYNC
jgi:hypothetical protein